MKDQDEANVDILEMVAEMASDQSKGELAQALETIAKVYRKRTEALEWVDRFHQENIGIMPVAFQGVADAVEGALKATA